MPSLALSGVLLGALATTNWFVLYTGLMFGFAVVIGMKRPPKMMRWILALAAGTPLVQAAFLAAGWVTEGGNPWFVEILLRLGAAMVAILPGLGAGLLYRRLKPRFTKAAA
jgi:hypothetical protein